MTEAEISAEDYHIEAIKQIQHEARLKMQPHIDALAYMRSLRPAKPLFVQVDEKGHIITPSALKKGKHHGQD